MQRLEGQMAEMEGSVEAHQAAIDKDLLLFRRLSAICLAGLRQWQYRAVALG